MVMFYRETKRDCEVNQRERKWVYNTVSSAYHIWLCSIATDKVLVEKQEEIKKLTREKGGEL